VRQALASQYLIHCPIADDTLRNGSIPAGKKWNTSYQLNPEFFGMAARRHPTFFINQQQTTLPNTTP
jgi:hypothetical protein